jgi:hypothetical protein
MIDDEYKEKSLRENLLDFGYKITTLEMPREFYLANRMSTVEREKLIDILKTLEKIIWDKHSPILLKHRKAHHFNFGVLGIGTSVWPEEDFVRLEKFFAEKGLSREDYFEESASAAMWNQQCKEHETYADYLKWCDAPLAFDEKLIPISEKEFNKRKSKEEVSYRKQKKVGDFLNRKGEDLDFIICSERKHLDGDYSRSEIEDLRLVFLEGIKEKGYNIREEWDYLDGGIYLINPDRKQLIRCKSIDFGEHDGSCRISFPDSRSFHFYFESENLDLKIKKERIDNWSFCQIIRRGNVGDLEATVHNGEENGIFENPDYSRFERA